MFEQLPSRLGGVPDVAHPMVQPAPQVYPIADIVQKGVEGVENILKTFDPMSRAEREAKIAQNAVLLHAYQLGQQGNMKGMQEALEYMNGKHDEWKDAIARSVISKNRAKAYHDMHPTPRGGAGGSSFLGIVNKAVADRQKLTGPKDPGVATQVAPMEPSPASVFNPGVTPETVPTQGQTNVPDTGFASPLPTM